MAFEIVQGIEFFLIAHLILPHYAKLESNKTHSHHFRKNSLVGCAF